MDTRFLDAMKAALPLGEPLAAALCAARDLAPGAGIELALHEMAGSITTTLKGFIQSEERRLAQLAEVATADRAQQ
jgi:hypothetical protein